MTQDPHPWEPSVTTRWPVSSWVPCTHWDTSGPYVSTQQPIFSPSCQKLCPPRQHSLHHRQPLVI